MYRYGLIGNCQVSALISDRGSLDWLCLPRPDSEPVFGALLDPNGGRFSIDVADAAELVSTRQRYVENTNILITEVSLRDGSGYRITDFCPRFEQFGRMYRPAMILRRVEPMSGCPRIRTSLTPVLGWSKTPLRAIRGNSHIRFEERDDPLRVLTNMPLTHLCDGSTHLLTAPIYFALTSGLGVEDDLERVFHDFLERTSRYWQNWVKHCTIPSYFQRETIRSALALKLQCFEDTGAILAAPTTSLPEIHGDVRNWDYRFCWLRDAYFALTAFHSLGHFEEMEGFLKFLLDLAHSIEEDTGRLRPVYSLSHETTLPESEHGNWAGYANSKPVRSRNQAGEHVQNDVYGEVILTLAPIFFDERFFYLRTPDVESLLDRLGAHCALSINQPDAGLWEVRNTVQVHSFTNLLCWAGLQRLQRIRDLGFMRKARTDIGKALSDAETSVRNLVTCSGLPNGSMDPSADAALSLAPILRFPDESISRATVEAIEKSLQLPQEGFYYRYKRSDDFGTPESAFVICSFWMAQAFTALQNRPRALRIIHQSMRAANELGLFAEHFDPQAGLQLGNFPQTYSHVGLINAAFAVSPPWAEIL